jgi:hypothetical protein
VYHAKLVFDIEWCCVEIWHGLVWRGSGMVDETKLQFEQWGLSKKMTTMIGGHNIGLRTFMVDKTRRKGKNKVILVVCYEKQ